MTKRKPSAARAREIDAATLKAFAHPLRIRMYDYLKDHGAATASTLAEAMGESTGQTSYHLRQLAKHGLITEDASRGTARERWWEAQGFSFGLEAVEEDPAALTAVELVMRQGVEERRRRQLEWIDRQRDEDRRWQEVVSFNEATVAMTPEELEAVSDALGELLDSHVRRAKEARRAEGGHEGGNHEGNNHEGNGLEGNGGRRTVKIYSQLFPLPPEA